ncbi:endo-1,4-beta-xylanase [Cellulomonas palmilytica]|uniref:endo-1,4-beta-xylanase n=1 Tax=Cellulomonas palmilytica TaxID=2608402 RepID=UPI001F32C000|nr:endo-1,4-beta-xylanase [Cellulomonas palmilytica]UJP38859.1 endo-1,4-beta-xylanase [Cellulomonas palmilytica]
MAALDHRTTSTVLTVLDEHGSPLADRDVVIAQTRHAFGFGCIAFDEVRLAPGERPPLDDLWHGLFDTATLPFYWRYFEPEEGRPRTAALEAAARRLVERGVRVKGHPLLWHTLAPQWLLGRPVEEVERIARERITRDVTAFAGLVDTWDAINEVVIMPVFRAEENAVTPLAWQRGRIETIRLAFETAREANPNATLLLNDFDMSTAYECLIEGVLEAGIQVDALGLQSHMHQGWWGEEKTHRVLERFSRFGLPLHFTETTLVSGHLMPPEIDDLNDYVVDSWPSTPEGEERQAAELARHYTLLAEHPAVQSVTYWGLGDEGAWLGAPAGLVRRDGTPKPAYHALRDLVRGEWWHAPTTLRTDAEGRVTVTGWRGDYEGRVAGEHAAFVVDDDAQAVVRLARD